MADNLAGGRKIRLLTIVDNFSRECLALDVAAGFKGTDVAQALTRIVAERGRPGQIRCDSGPEFISNALDQWAYWNKVELDFSRPGKPTDNAFIESFNGRVRQELLNASCLKRSIKPAKWPRLGVPNTMTIGRTDRSEMRRRKSSPERMRRPHQRPEISSYRWPKIGYTVRTPATLVVLGSKTGSTILNVLVRSRLANRAGER